MDFKSKLKEIITRLLDNIHEQRKLILALSCVVVFVTTYVLILPAFTLEKTEAAKQGGIDVPGVEQAEDADETADEETGGKTDAAHAGKQKEAKAEKAAKESKQTMQSKGSSDVTLQNEDSEDYIVAVEGKDDVLSEDMSVNVREIDKSTKKLKKEYDSLYSDALKAVQKEEGSEKPSTFAFAKFYDISLMNGDAEAEPADAVDVKITFSEEMQKELKVADPDRLHIVHFAVDKETGETTPEVLDPETTDIVVEKNKMTEAAFTTDSFSVFAVVYTVDFHYEVDGKKYDYSMDGGSYISLAQIVKALKVNDDAATFVASIEKAEFSDPDLVWVGKVEEDTTVGALKEANGLKPEYSTNLTKEQIAKEDAKTVKAGDWALISLKPFDTEETLTVTMKNGDVFRIKVTDDNDPLGLNGRTFAIVTNKGNAGTRHSLQAEVHTNKDSRGYYMSARQLVNYIEIGGAEYCDRESTAWTFEYNAEKDAYYISNNGKYLYIDPNITSKNGSQDHSLNLVSNKNISDGGTLITITRDDSGNYYFGNKNGTLLWDYGNSYWLSNPATDEGNNKIDAAIRLCLPENPYGSHKASMTAAKDLSNGQSVIIYQKIWNSEKDAYDFFAIDGNGKLQTVWESSDSLYWKQDLSIEWTLKELTDSQGKPTGYLQLYNEKTHTYLAPRTDGTGYTVVTNESALTEDTMKYISVSLPGRDSGAYASRVATWDYNANTTYGLEVRRDSQGKVNAGDNVGVNELLKSQEFYFAVRDPLVQKQLTTVDTVDSVAKGIKITMYDFSGTEGWNSGRWYQEGVGWQQANDRLQYMTDVIGNADWRTGYYWPNLMSRTLEANGYPRSTETNRSLGDIFNRSSIGAKDANHLFLQSVYDTTGYFYYSGFDNFARLPDNSNDFIVYDQLGTPQNQGTTEGKPSHPENFFYYRGNFMPFNELDTNDSVLNYYDGGDQRKELSDDDPRKSEDLYKVKGDPNYFFGMIMESKFQQGPNGLSDQGDPMVFEFTGDDDMWVYVDGVLLLDIGGIHDAFHGKINFQTGKITVDVQKTGNDGVTYIREQYWQAKKFPDGTAWTDRNDPKQFEFFTDGGEDNGKLVGTYKDYSTHDLKMFYMERGKGASNLKIQFNLPVITGDEFRVTKNMLETASGQQIQNDYADAAFYYRAYIKSGNTWVPYKHSDMTNLTDREAVYDDDSKSPVVWKDDYIFEVKPGGTAVIPVKDSSVEYKVVEVEPEENSHMLDVYNVTNSDQDPVDSKSTTGKTVMRRGQVFFDNKPIDEIVNELRITKNLHGNLYVDSDTASGYVEDQNGSPYFEYRIFLEATNGTMVPYSLGEYYQIDGATGKYVYYDSRKQGKDKRCLAETELDDNGKVTYIYEYADGTVERLTEPKITEHTSQNGSLGDVRPDDTIIIKGLLEGTDFIVDERIDRTHMRQHTEDGQDWEEEWNNKYYYSNTDVAGAYIRGNGDSPDVSDVNVPENWKLAEATIYKEPTVPEQVSNLLTGNEAKGTIIASSNAEVKVHNQVYNQFELPLKKTWSSDFKMDELDDNAQVTFTLKRYRLETRSAALTLKASVIRAPAGYDQTYVLKNNETGETFTVKYSEMNGADTRSIELTLPIGTYTVTCEGGPTGYTAEHTKSAGTVTVTASDEHDSGGVASPNEIVFTSSFSRQSGSLQVTKNLAGYYGNQSFEKFKALYFITDMAGNIAKDTAGNTVEPVTLQYSDFNGKASKTITFDNLPAGQYLVREQLNGTAYDNDKFTIVNTADPESRTATVSGGQPGQVTFTSTYTEVKANPVKVEVVLSNIYNSNVETLYSNTTSFRPGDQIIIRFTRKDNNTNVRYRINNGDWSAYTAEAGNSGRDVTEEISLTVPENGVRVEFQDNWTQLKAEHILVRKAETQTVQSAQSSQTASNAAPARTMLKAAPRLRAAGNSTINVGPVSNTGRMPEPADSKQRYQTDSWQLVVTMKNGGDLLDEEGTKIGSFTVDGNTWSVTLEGAKIDGLTADDGENGYYYYIDSVSEKNVPDGTTPSVDNEANGGRCLYSEADKGTGKKLSVSNELLVANKSIRIVKYTKGTTTPLPGAKFTLTEVDVQGHEVRDGYRSGEITVDPKTGVIEFTGLKPGTYKLEETYTPDGYVKSEGAYFIVVNKDGSSSVDTELTVSHALINKDAASGSFIVENEPGAELPHTGGIGTTIFYILGFAIVAASGAGLMIRRKKKAA